MVIKNIYSVWIELPLSLPDLSIQFNGCGNVHKEFIHEEKKDTLLCKATICASVFTVLVTALTNVVPAFITALRAFWKSLIPPT